ncbi:helix-turn-helix domain-containing protein [Luteolibacter pohnpeiensis]|uniref:Helix-turn-helix domain-containing protein n=1 Tax=Luteolibacter pohnpeiensis TaxID=454153 RepID=A0A934VW98_9BACT|nr:helix-turn-helix domain-containing protein [Luteolibacter pohnpeiensis]MBK1884392.1 helix-turn-helix domain-containing protein [Luteolibacter pohnpeiensis]
MKTSTTSETNWVKARDIARRYNVTERAVYGWKDEGRIPHIKIGKVVRFDLDAVIEAIEGKGTQA